MADIHDFNGIFIKPTAWYLLTISGPNPPVPGFHHPAASSHSNNDQVIKNARKLTAIAKTYGFNSLSETIVVRMKALHRPQKEAIALIRVLIESSNLFKVQRALKKDVTFNVFAVKCVQEMVKDEMSAVVSNPKLSMASSKISPDTIEGFFILTIDNKHAKNAPILRSLLRASAGSIGIPSHSSCWGVENPDGNNISDKSEAEEGIKVEDEMN